MDGKMQIQALDGSWSDVGYVEGIAKQADIPAHLIVPPPAGMSEKKLPPPPLMPSSIDEIPGDFPTVDLMGTPSAAKQKLIDQVDPCELTPHEKLVMATKEKQANAALKGIGTVTMKAHFDAGPMIEAIHKMQASFQGIYAAVQPVFAGMVELLDTSSNVGRAEKLRRRIPGANERVKMPCDCSVERTQVWYAIQHLNDDHNPVTEPPFGDFDPWSRERIADWLETLDVDLRVSSPPSFEIGQRVHARISHAAGTVTGLAGNGLDAHVQWDKSVAVGIYSLFELVAGEPEPLPQVDESFYGTGLNPGDHVQDKASGEIGRIVEMKSDFTADQVQLKVAYPNGTLFQFTNDVVKYDLAPPPPMFTFEVGQEVTHAKAGHPGKILGIIPNYDGSEDYRVEWTINGVTTIGVHVHSDQLAALKKALAEPSVSKISPS